MTGEETSKRLASLSDHALMEESSEWISDMNSAFWEAQKDIAPSEGMGKYLSCELHRRAKVASDKKAAYEALPACSFCNGKGTTGIPTYQVLCTVCRGTMVDQAALLEWSKGKGWQP